MRSNIKLISVLVGSLFAISAYAQCTTTNKWVGENPTNLATGSTGTLNGGTGMSAGVAGGSIGTGGGLGLGSFNGGSLSGVASGVTGSNGNSGNMLSGIGSMVGNATGLGNITSGNATLADYVKAGSTVATTYGLVTGNKTATTIGGVGLVAGNAFGDQINSAGSFFSGDTPSTSSTNSSNMVNGTSNNEFANYVKTGSAVATTYGVATGNQTATSIGNAGLNMGNALAPTSNNIVQSGAYQNGSGQLSNLGNNSTSSFANPDQGYKVGDRIDITTPQANAVISARQTYDYSTNKWVAPVSFISRDSAGKEYVVSASSGMVIGDCVSNPTWCNK